MAEIKAVINGERIECGACGALLCKKSETVVNAESLTQEFRMNRFTGEITQKMIYLEIKCKHKDKGKTCNAINKIKL